ncbi:MAG: nucleoside deaminase, partial [Erysipelotrichaceae bacterium]|nr:nucleoside deaminase [Erysipelotrichaceae bacterium]
MTKEEYMKLAIQEAKKAAKKDEVPIGCIIVCNDQVIAKGHNQRESKQLTKNHAEM